MVHMKQSWKDIQLTSTKRKTTDLITDIEKDRDKGQHTNLVFVKAIMENEATGVLYDDLPGPFPVLSSQGNRYIRIFYSYDFNAVMNIPMKTRHDS